MNDPYFMNILYCRDELVKHSNGFSLVDSFVLNDIVEELAFLHVLHNKKKLFRCFDYLVELHNVGVPDQF